MEAVADGRSGLLVENRNTANLAKALEALMLDRRKRSLMGRQAREHVLARFTWGQHVDKLLDIYDRALSG